LVAAALVVAAAAAAAAAAAEEAPTRVLRTRAAASVLAVAVWPVAEASGAAAAVDMVPSEAAWAVECWVVAWAAARRPGRQQRRKRPPPPRRLGRFADRNHIGNIHPLPNNQWHVTILNPQCQHQQYSNEYMCTRK
jgi:hypothetical protein